MTRNNEPPVKSRARRLRRAGVLALGLLVALPAVAAQRHAVAPDNGRNSDARIAENARVQVTPNEAQVAAVQRLKGEMPDAMVRFEPTTGATRTIQRPVGFLTHAVPGADHREVARFWVEQHLDLLGLDEGDVAERELTDEVVSDVTGASHVYWRQTLDGVPVYNGQLHVNVARDGQVISVNNAFVPNLRRSANSLRPRLSGEEAVAAALASIGVDAQPTALATGGDARQTTQIDPAGFSLSPVTAQLMLLPVNQGNARLVWNFTIDTVDETHLFDFNVDAISGQVWTRFDLTSDAQYRVYAEPDESPLHGTQTRSLEVDPHNRATNASPNGWHSTGSSSFTILRGNNAHAYHDRDGNNSPPASQPSSGSLSFDFAINLSQDPVNFINAAVTNLFYWNNLIHDIQYQHGFTESAGNFQVNNFGRGGSGNDDVRAEAQDNADGSSRCNANFSTPTDGGRPRMQMFVCNNATPQRDGDLDNGVIVHEYGHGISIRQVGGPSNSSCLNNSQQGGEGWSDWHALVYTAEVGDAGTDKRGIGTYLFGQGPTGDGIRPQPYSTSSAINNYTYQSIAGQSIPHGVGSVWAQAIWEVYWVLVAKHGFDPDLYNPGSASGAAGNNRALTYINEGLKNTACSPTFIDARDGIIAAATSLHGGEDVCDIWEAFAAFGLGTNASTGGSNSTTATNGFNVPSTCDGTPPPPPPGDCPADAINFSGFGLQSYADQNVSNNSAVLDGGDTLQLTGNTWLRSTQSFTVAADTVIEFQYASNSQGEIHSIGFDETNTLNDAPRHFQFWGTQNWTGAGKAAVWSPQYTGAGAFQTFTIPVGTFFTGGSMRLVFGNDKDSGTLNNEGRYRCVRVVSGGTPPPTGICTVDDGFEAGATGWFNDGASTCSTGAYVLASPTLVSNGGVTTQVGGDHTSGGGNAIFTATNSSAGVDDVDGGNCILGSPTWSVVNASTLSVWYFHGQRDSGGDASGDFFRLEVSTNGGSTWTAIASNGDSTSNAAWTQATHPIPAGSSVRLRVQASDGTASGDLVEAGIDDLSICDN